MRIKKIKFKNFTSYGNRLQEISFDEKNSDLYLVLGDNGAGKCLDSGTRLDVNVEDTDIRKKFLQFLKERTINMINCSIKDLNEFNKLNGDVDSGYFEVNTRRGFKKINQIGITAKNSTRYKITTKAGNSIISSPDHLFFYKKWKKAKFFKSGDLIETKNGLEEVCNNIILPEKSDLFDIEVDEIHEFFANEFVSHNSSLSKVITYLCYGKVDGSNLRDLPNRVNKELWGYIELESKNNKIEIERGINPNKFNVKINGVPHDVAGKTPLQEFLENEMYEIPYHVFKNVIILSINDFKSFITMSPYDKKMIIDKIFGFSIINEMRDIIKEDRKKINQEIIEFTNEINSISESIQSVSNKIKEIEEKSEERNTERIKKLKKDLLGLKDNRNKLINANQKLKDKISKINSIFNETLNQKSEIKNDIKNTKRWINLYKKDTCPTCSSSLKTKFHKDLKKTKETELNTLQENLENTQKELDNNETNLIKARDNGKKISIKIGQLETQMNSLKNELLGIMKREDKDSDYFKQLISEFKNKKEFKNTEKLNKEGDNYYLTILENLMGDDGIKNLAIRSLLPSFNTHIDVMAKEIGIPFRMKFDDKFNCSIFHLGDEISPKTLSTGERKKADFVIIMAMIKMIKIRFPSFNILFLDEIFSSIDAGGVYHIISILHKTIRKIGLNTFVINHTTLPSEYFDKKIHISKDSGFSEFNIETIK